MATAKARRPGEAHATDRFGLLFAELLALLIFTAFVETSRLFLILDALMVIVIVLTALRAAGTTPARMRLAFVIAISAFMVVVVGGAWGNATIRGVIWVGVGVVLALGAAAVIRRIFEHDRIGLPHIIAALAAYLQIGLAFASVYAGIGEMSSAPFFAQDVQGVTGVYLYFSIVTITTLGYGDFTPATALGRSLVMIETVFGQIILVVLVAYLIGTLGGTRTRLRDRETSE